jgi:large conductance mechanosensitive channel
VLFFIVRSINAMQARRAKAAEVAEPPAPSAEEVLLTEIRDLLRAQRLP